MIVDDLTIASDLMISKIAADKLFWWSDVWMFLIVEVDWMFSLIDSVKNNLITVIRKSIDSDDKTILQVSFSMRSNLNDSVHLSRWLRLSHHIKTFELRDRSWIEVIIELLRMFKASIIWCSARIFLISIIAFSIIIIRWVINEIKRFMTCMRKYASKISKMSINSSESTVSLIVLIIIWRIISLLIVDLMFKFLNIIWYARCNSAWYRFLTSIN
jgi:hypothetical protein